MCLKDYLSKNFVREAKVTSSGDSAYLPTYSIYEIADKAPNLSESQAYYLFLLLFFYPIRVEKGELFGNEVVIGVFLDKVDELVERINACPIDLLEFVRWHVKKIGVANFDIESAEIVTSDPCSKSFPSSLKIRTLEGSVRVSGVDNSNKYILATPKA